MRSKIAGWRFPVIALVAVACATASSGSPTPIPAESPGPTAAPSRVAVADAAGPALTETFTSTLHGISVSYPDR